MISGLEKEKKVLEAVEHFQHKGEAYDLPYIEEQVENGIGLEEILPKNPIEEILEA